VSQFLGVMRHEFGMSLRRPGMWIAYGLLSVFYAVVFFTPSPGGDVFVIPAGEAWPYAGQVMSMFNMLMPLAGGILAADRIQRDFQLRVRELQQSTPLSLPAYVLGKYCGVLLSVLLPTFAWTVLVSILAIPLAGASLDFLGAMLVAFLAVSVPAYAFVVAFSLACPLVMPLRVYQILFTGYWFWANYLNPEIFPTLNGTLLTPGGKFIVEAFFGSFTLASGEALATSAQAWANLLVLGLCIVAVLTVLNLYLARQARQA
jgi:ABC-2 type transport system permease protein